MLVIANDATATVIDGRAVALPAGRQVDLPDDRAKQLIKAGVVRAVDPEQGQGREKDEQPEKPQPAAKRRGAAPENKQA